MAEISSMLGVHNDAVTHNVRVKTYPDGSSEILAASMPVFREPGWELSDKSDSIPSERTAARDNDNVARAMRRARVAVRDLARCTPFRFFVTLTLDAAKVGDRYDDAAIIRRLSSWLDNRVRRAGLAYVIIPEHHKDGAIHFHGFVNDALPVVDSGHRDAGGHTVFNLPAWDYGFSTAIELYGEYSAAVSYVCKYIGKQGEKIGGRWYYSGGCLRRPDVDITDGDIDVFATLPGAYAFDVPEARARFVRVEMPARGFEE